MKTNKVLNVYYNGNLVGILASTKTHKIAFQYDSDWLKNGFSISPISLPLKKGLFIPKNFNFDGLFGVFYDSLPDAWGRLLLEKYLKSLGVKEEISQLDRLSIVGKNGMGALVYKPTSLNYFVKKGVDLDEISKTIEKLLNKQFVENIDELYKMGGTSGGARPKVLINYNEEEWIVKFKSPFDDSDVGVMEYEYMRCAEKCGINIPEINLFNSKVCEGYFGIKRFDIENENRVHMISAAALLEANYKQPVGDYIDLMKLTQFLTNRKTDIEQLFKRMCFNVFAKNMDDHLKNFSFIYCEKERRYELSPAYDLTYSPTYYYEHTTSINGKGKNIKLEDLIEVGVMFGLSKEKCEKIALTIESHVKQDLNKYINK